MDSPESTCLPRAALLRISTAAEARARAIAAVLADQRARLGMASLSGRAHDVIYKW